MQLFLLPAASPKRCRGRGREVRGKLPSLFPPLSLSPLSYSTASAHCAVHNAESMLPPGALPGGEIILSFAPLFFWSLNHERTC